MYSTYYMSQSVIWRNISLSRLIYFHELEAVKIKPESEISSHITLTECTSVISGLFHTRYLAEVVSRYVTLGVN